MLIELQRATDGLKPGTWKAWQFLDTATGYKWAATVCCPDCGRLLSLANHSIAENGQVSPSVGHPPEYPPCGWHTHPILLGWGEQLQKPLPPSPDLHTCEKCNTVSRSIFGWGTWSGGRGLICANCIAK